MDAPAQLIPPQLIEAGWWLFKGIMTGGIALLLWGVKRILSKEKEQDETIAKLKEQLAVQEAVQKARSDMWRELGAPERRRGNDHDT